MKLFIKLLLLLSVISCKFNNENNEFLKQISSFDGKIRNHFPKKLKNENEFAIFKSTNTDVISIFLLNKYKEREFKHIKDSLISLSKKSYKPNDSCLLVINMYSNEKNYFNSFKTSNLSYLTKNCLKDKLPIPNFWPLEFKTNNLTKLSGDYVIYVFDAKREIISQKYFSINVFMPKSWEHGFSKGIAINDKSKEIIYWFVLW